MKKEEFDEFSEYRSLDVSYALPEVIYSHYRFMGFDEHKSTLLAEVHLKQLEKKFVK